MTRGERVSSGGAMLPSDKEVATINEIWRREGGSLPEGLNFTEGLPLDGYGEDYAEAALPLFRTHERSGKKYFDESGYDLLGRRYKELGLFVDRIIHRKSGVTEMPNTIVAGCVDAFPSSDLASGQSYDFSLVGTHPKIAEFYMRNNICRPYERYGMLALGMGISAVEATPDDAQLGFVVLTKRGVEKSFRPRRTLGSEQ